MSAPVNLTIGNRKVAIIGVGFVGASIAYALTLRNLAREIVLIDIDENKLKGEALDIGHGIPYMGISAVYAGDYCDCANCDLIIVTAGRNRRPGETRIDMIQDNVGILKDVVSGIKRHYTRGVIMIVSNPVDILTYICAEWMELPNGKVFGTGCILDTSRLVRIIADYTSLSTEVVNGVVVGEHGDAQIPVWSRLTIAGVSMKEYCDNMNLPWTELEKTEIYTRVKSMGSEIIAAKGKTHFGIATCVCSLADAVLNRRLTVAPVTTPFEGELGIHGVSMSIPSIVGGNGVEKRIEEKWNDMEMSSFRESAEKLRQILKNKSTWNRIDIAG